MAKIILETEDSVKEFVRGYAEKKNWTMSLVLRGIIDDWIAKKRNGALARTRGRTTKVGRGGKGARKKS